MNQINQTVLRCALVTISGRSVFFFFVLFPIILISNRHTTKDQSYFHDQLIWNPMVLFLMYVSQGNKHHDKN